MSTCTANGAAARNTGDGDFDVVVLGACITDFISYVPHIPLVGETVRGNSLEQGFGGKGGNQCVAAAKLGSKTAMIAKLGQDSLGLDYKDHLIKHNVNVDHVKLIDDEKTGIAQINVAENGDNQIVIVLGANNRMTFEDVEEVDYILEKAKVLICQLETPMKPSMKALGRFKGISILNAAPAPLETSLDIFSLPSILCINEVEAASITKRKVPNIEEAKRAIHNLLSLGCRSVIITFGRLGALFATSDDPKPIHVRVPKIAKVVDTTGAGDAFIGALAHYTAIDSTLPMLQRVGAAVHIATYSVQRNGTQSSYPVLEDLEDFDVKSKVFDWSYA